MLLALAASALVVFGSPYVGEIRGAIESAFPSSYRAIVLGIIAMAAAVALVAAFIRIREHRVARYLALAAAGIVAVVYAWATGTGNANVDAVERFHFIEYGLLTFIYYRVWRDHDDLSSIVLPACATFIIAVLDEGVQWFVPSRVGELHDVLINLAAIASGLLFSVAIEPVRSFYTPSRGSVRLALGTGVACVVLALALFIDRVHLGYEIDDARAGTFRSQYRAAELSKTPWTGTTTVVPGFAREDHYLSEALWHLQERNRAEGQHEPQTAWHENLILERFYAPVLDAVGRWPPEQREARRLEAAPSKPYVSNAAPYPIFTVSRPLFWAIVAVLLALIGGATRVGVTRARVQ